MERLAKEIVVELLMMQHRDIEGILQRLLAHFQQESWQQIGERTTLDLNQLRDLMISHLEQEQKLLFAWVLRHGTHSQQLVYQGFWQSGLALARLIQTFFKNWQYSWRREEELGGFLRDLQALACMMAERIHTEERLLYPSFAHDTYISPLFLQDGDVERQPDAEQLHHLTLQAISECMRNEEISQLDCWQLVADPPSSWVDQTEGLE
ncbi:MAG: hemerythrin domain-containing protein [Magnetococcales bacterium]|nr:hemerythrin domain-containing protein [Magnetococcales bacterium]MBF0113827.1 hemerythrin domain-containing protein [Magnetococcales bacterium]